jgi:hypothetical protein
MFGLIPRMVVYMFTMIHIGLNRLVVLGNMAQLAQLAPQALHRRLLVLPAHKVQLALRVIGQQRKLFKQKLVHTLLRLAMSEK